MIRLIDIRLNAAHPELPLCEAVTYTGAPSTVLIRGVPPNCGRWAITAVFVAASFPDGSTTTRAAVQSANGVWVATLPATATSGRTANGIRIMANGVDENGEAVTGYILGVADFAVASLAVTPAPEPGGIAYALRYFDSLPDPAKKGDVIRVNGDLKFYNGTAWQPFTDLSDYYTAEQTDEAIDKLAAYYITADAQGNPFATHAALVNAQTYYSGGAARTPTRNDYAVVSADEMHNNAEWRYIYAVDAQGVGQWEPQYAVEGVIAYDKTVTRTSANGVKSSGIWSMLWGALTTALPEGFSSLYDWVVDQLALKANDNAVVHLTGEQQTISAVLQLMSTLYAESGVESHGDYRLTWRVEGDYAGTLTISQDTISVQLANEQSARQYRFQAGGGGTLALLENIAPAFVHFQSYGVNELCTSFDADSNHKGYWLYKCIVATDGSTPPEIDTTHWTLATVEDVLAALRTAIAGKADASAIPYALVTKTITSGAVSLDDRASNAVTISTTLSPNTLTINFPTATSGRVRDFAMRLNIAAGVTAPEIAWPQGVTLENNGGEVPEIADGGTGGSSTILYFSETENNGTTAKFLVKGEALTAITQA